MRLLAKIFDTETLKIHYTTEFLNSRNPSGLAAHELRLKEGAIIMLLRNLNSSKGLCNGTRLIVVTLYYHNIKARVLTGRAKGHEVYILRISMQPTDTDLPFTLDSIQFPITLAFAMTINKAQGQSLSHVGIFLPSPVFSHGQLYAVFSRGTSKETTKVLIKNTPTQGKLFPNNQSVYTKNVVYNEMFQ